MHSSKHTSVVDSAKNNYVENTQSVTSHRVLRSKTLERGVPRTFEPHLEMTREPELHRKDHPVQSKYVKTNH